MKTIHITSQNLRRLQKLLSDAENFNERNRGDLESLKGELERASVLEPSAIPPDVITMNSQAELVDLETKEKSTFTLVFPPDSDADTGKVSVLAPIGAGMLGYRVGDEFSWSVPNGVRRFKVSTILYQPEAAGDCQG